MAGWSSWPLGVLAPIAGIAVIIEADVVEGPEASYLGLLAVVPMFAAVFARPAATATVGAVTWLAALMFSITAADGSLRPHFVRLGIIAVVTVLAIVASALRLRQEQRLAMAEREAATILEVRRLSETDELTGVLNRRGLLQALGPRERLGDRTVALMDIDDLKDVNDNHGHQVGDRYITAIAQRVTASLAGTGIIGRWGGDEFLIVIDLPAPEAVRILDRAHDRITGEPAGIVGRLIPVSVSLGVARWPAGAALDAPLALADRALYEAKSAGRNRTAYPR